MKKNIIWAAAALFLSTAAQAAPILVESYDMPNGQTGSFTYFDDSYDGTGNTGSPLAPLSGGTGDLTDGVIAERSWNIDHPLYVGWFTVDPLIRFTFAEAVAINSVTVYFDDPVGQLGGVFPLGSATINGSTTAISFNSLPHAGPTSFTFTDFDFTGTQLDIQFVNPGTSYLMVSEITFDGRVLSDAVDMPTPAPLALLGLGLVGLGLVRRRTQ